ncbi:MULTISPECIES: signal peptidase II [Maribacter]|uniref:Lipoprotein signal peptidase n=1 Tax=Maribacter flavus TaxID=1658664 RepID=A0ABU7IIG5_9FLAO|nr:MULTISPECIES: signal peptidase II [Maribacter]MDC6405573.1 signal peptidase II [Maribacter sp. PR66]MEE1972659.1 signal peptidase II [Maribacter flavus]
MNSTGSKLLSRFLIILLVLLNIGCDQVSKKVVRENVSYQEYIPLIQDHFILTNVENTGAMLGFGSNFPPALKVILFQVLPLIVLLVLLYRMLTRTHTNKWMLWAFAFVIGGGIGNLIDRIALGSVTDFFQIRLGFFKTGIFNMADVAVTTGVLLILFLSLFGKKITI